ncbi:SusD/RagB family nutrient-binding outer membrane lipoprotein [Dyadobacter aurulentus]|uniref:SusD/RagB family nutrient-binding outer membrane lipoprotein n=1 Tax=Dyadobacter sp. UC 10 TaxID=2605428 RepID=UPI0011F26D1B|nr:SusD/RagB family nutrient-binding outer membrane lipoprotein [Dyadobacter sp. UC 10]KAA0992449.1 SusD/RagB family nutrient-binding outer membrane lipoprotein [Dyadobacter sp. UC 10]
MKHLRIKSIVLAIMGIFMVSSCKDITELNDNPNGVNPLTANPSLVLSTVLTETGRAFVNLGYQDVAGIVQHTQKDGWSGGHNDYDWGQENSWSGYYDILRNNQYVYERSVELKYELHQGIALVIKSMIFGLIADLWGDAPYTNALKAAQGGTENTFPAFDSQESIYMGILDDLEKANVLLSKNAAEYAAVGNSDVYYQGNPAKWRKLANSLKLRYYMRMSVKKADFAKAGIETIVANPTQYPIITAAADDATMAYAGNSSADSWPGAVRFDPDSTNYRRIKMCATFVEYLQAGNDPRLGVFANKVQIPLVVDSSLPKGTDRITNGKRYLSPDKVTGAIDTDQEYVGLPVSLLGGASYNMSPTAAQGARNPHVSWLNSMYMQPTGALLKSRLMSAAEVNFILAEAAQKGWAAGDAKTNYEAAIQASFTTWGVAGALPAYLAQPLVAYNGTLRQIIEQKWIASWTAATEAWFDYRRTGFPELKTGPQSKRAALPLRFYYMLDERNLNKANADNAISKLEVTKYSEADGKNSAWSKPWLLQGTTKPW